MADENNVFSDNLNTTVTLEALVGEGKKYSDTDALAKGYVNAEDHIQELRRDLAQARAEKDLANNNRGTPPVKENEQIGTPAAAPASPPVGKDDLRSLMREELKALSTEEKYQRNVDMVASKMVEVFGDADKATEAVRKRAAELNVSVEWLRDAASKSPSAFYASMGLNPDQAPTNRETPAPKNDSRPPSTNVGIRADGERTYEYFAELKKTDKVRYHSPEVQKEMQIQAKKLGDAFYLKR